MHCHYISLQIQDKNVKNKNLKKNTLLCYVRYLKSVGNFVAKTVLVESANQFILEELCRTKNCLKYFFEVISSIRPSGKTLKLLCTNINYCLTTSPYIIKQSFSLCTYTKLDMHIKH